MYSIEQMDRLEHYKRAYLKRDKIKSLMQSTLGELSPAIKSATAEKLAIGVGGIAKLYAADIVVAAKKIQGSEEGPLQPKHIKAAVAQLTEKRLY